jgi:hypothetical protein
VGTGSREENASKQTARAGFDSIKAGKALVARCVIAGPDPAIHPQKEFPKSMDVRVKPGHDT